MKKFISLILVIVMISCLVTGCKPMSSRIIQTTTPPTGMKSITSYNSSSHYIPSSNNMDITPVIANYDVIKGINSYESNQKILDILFGWSDKIDYTKLEKVEIKEDGYLKTQYMDSEKVTKFGWAIKMKGSSAEYEYHFPQDKDKELIIYRENINTDNNIVRITTKNMHKNRTVNIQMFLPTDGSMRGVSILNQKQDYENDGLYFERAQDNDLVMMYEMGFLLDYYFYSQKVLLQEEHHSYSGNDVSSNIKTYNSSGILMSEYFTKNGSLDGLQITNFEDGSIYKSIEWKDGKINGKSIQYYASGKIQISSEYLNGIKHGQYTQFYNNDANQIMETGMYSNNKQNGIWLTYKSDGALKNEIIWDHGVAK